MSGSAQNAAATTPDSPQNSPSNPPQHQSSSNNSNQHQSATSWAEPPWCGWIETTGDALIILEAARRGLIPRVTRRLVDSERKMITSGSVFVFDEDESGIKRWTDGFYWSPSRILGNFLLYRETDKRGAGHRGSRNDRDSQELPGSNSSLLVNELATYGTDKDQSQSLSRPKGENSSIGLDKQRERSLVGSLTNSYKFKPDGMMKKTFSLTIGGVSQHLISYYKIEDVEQGRLRTPSSLPELASLDISPEYLDKTHFRNPPEVEFDRDGRPRYRGEGGEEHSRSVTSSVSPHAPLSIGAPLLLESRGDPEDISVSSSASKRTKRYDPYGTGVSASLNTSSKRSRRTKSTGQPSSQTQSSSTSAHGHGHGHDGHGGHPQSTHQGSYPASPPDGHHPSPHFAYGVNYYSAAPPHAMYASPPHTYAAGVGANSSPGQATGVPTTPYTYHPPPDGPTPHAPYTFYAAAPHGYAPYGAVPWGYGYAPPPSSAIQGPPQSAAGAQTNQASENAKSTEDDDGED